MKNRNIIHKKKIRNPYFSIITVVKNDEKNIVKTIKSINNQTYKKFEHIIIDGKSEDNTIKNILKNKKNLNLLVSERDKGIYFAMNKGANIASGKIIVFINSGDLITKKSLKIVKKEFEKKNIDFVFGTVKRHYTKKTIIKHGFNKNRLLVNFDFATSHSTGFFIKNSIFKKLKYFNTKYKCSADYDLYYRLIIKNNKTGASTKKNQLIGIVQAGGFSSKFNFFQHLIEEIKIRFDNNQSLLIIFLIIVNASIKHFLKVLIK